MTIDNIVLPKESGSYKVLQIKKEKELYLRFSNTLRKYVLHKDIFLRFCKELGIKYKNDHKKCKEGIPMFTKKSGYKLVGAGYCNLNLKKKTAVFNGSSQGYLIKINKNYANKTTKLLTGFEVRFEKQYLHL